MLIFVSFLFAVAAALTMLTTANLKASTESKRVMNAFYLADSGAQIGNSLVRSAGGTLASTSFTEALAGGTVTVQITDLGGGLYQIQSAASYRGEQSTVEMQVSFDSSGFSLASGVQLSVDPGVEVEDGLPVALNGLSKISGLDHAADGTPLADQSGAVLGLGVNTLPENAGFQTTVAAGAVLEGAPSGTTTSAPNETNVLRALEKYTKDNADVFVSGTTALGSAATGLYGTAATPALVYVDLGTNQMLTMNETFSGYGTMLIKTSRNDNTSALTMAASARWHGLIAISVRGELEVDGGSLVRLQNDARIVGGMTLLVRSGGEIEFEGTGKLLEVSENASVLYSSALVSATPGISTTTSSNVKTVSYRVP